MWLVRKTSNLVVLADDARVDALATELVDDPTPDELSVYAVERPETVSMVAALYNAGRPSRSNPFDCVLIDEAMLASLAIELVPDERGSVFAWLRARHHVLRGVTEPRELASRIAASATRLPAARVREAIRSERRDLTVTTTAEWAQAAPWTRDVAPA